MKLFHPNITNVTVAGVQLQPKASPDGKGFILEVEDDFKHLGKLLEHGFTVLEDKILRRAAPAAPAPAASGGAADTGALAAPGAQAAPGTEKAPASADSAKPAAPATAAK